jgi:hypothetical protein
MLTLKFRSKLWRYAGPGSWHFITLPVKHAATIKALLRSPRRGWGSLSVTATIGSSSWKTSIFPEKKSKSYLLPVKADVRKKESIEDGDTVAVTLEVAM